MDTRVTAGHDAMQGVPRWERLWVLGNKKKERNQNSKTRRGVRHKTWLMVQTLVGGDTPSNLGSDIAKMGHFGPGGKCWVETFAPQISQKCALVDFWAKDDSVSPAQCDGVRKIHLFGGPPDPLGCPRHYWRRGGGAGTDPAVKDEGGGWGVAFLFLCFFK